MYSKMCNYNYSRCKLNVEVCVTINSELKLATLSRGVLGVPVMCIVKMWKMAVLWTDASDAPCSGH